VQSLPFRHHEKNAWQTGGVHVRLFAKRIKDAFYADSEQTEGGGSDDPLVVDYRLAVALKRAGSLPYSARSSQSKATTSFRSWHCVVRLTFTLIHCVITTNCHSSTNFYDFTQ
jgi:hypothetical protein